MSMDISINQVGKYMCKIDLDTAWWGQPHYKSNGSFSPHDAWVEISEGHDPAKYWRPLKFKRNGETYEGVKVIAREDTGEMISHVGGSTTIIQPQRFNELIEEVLQSTEVQCATYLLLANSTKIAATLLLDKDEYKQDLITIGTSVTNDRSTYLSGYRNRTLCANTEAVAWGSKKSTIRKTVNWENFIPRFKDFLKEFELHNEWADQFREAMQEIGFNKEDKSDLIYTLMPNKTVKDKPVPASTRLKNMRKNLNQFIIDGTGDRNGSVSDLYDGVTEYSSHPERSYFTKPNGKRYNERTSFATQAASEEENVLESKTVDFIYDRWGSSLPELVS